MLRTVTRSIRHKLALAALASALSALTVAGIALVINDLRQYRAASINDLVTQADILGRASTAALAFDDSKTAQENLQLLKAKPEIASAAIYNARGRIFGSYARKEAGGTDVPGLPETDGTRVRDGSLELFQRIVANNEILGTVYLKADYEVVGRVADYAGIFGAVAARSLLVALLIAARLQTVLIKPILATAEVAREVVEHRDFSLRARRTTNDEIGTLVDAFNDMLSEIGQRTADLEKANRSLAREMEERRHADEARQQLNAELERRVTERTAQLESANKELEGFSYSVSHDLRSPLRAIIGYGKMLIEDQGAQLDAEALRKLDVILGEAQRMGQLIDDLLAFSRLGRKAMQMMEIDMTGLARTVYEGIGRGGSLPSAELRLAALPRAMGDRVLIGQVWTNLLANALKFSGKRELPLIEVSAISDEKEHVYFVRDNGAGFDPRHRSKLFGVFQRLHSTSDFPGTGVGLALVERIVTRHGGRVWADGKQDEGATFYFTLPKEQGHATV